MLVKFTGEYSREERSYGCSKCGTGRSVSGKEVYKTSYRTYYGARLYIFNQDEPVEVDEVLGKYLLSRTYFNKEGVKTHSFVVVEQSTTTENAST